MKVNIAKITKIASTFVKTTQHTIDWKSPNIIIKHVSICCNPYIYTIVVREVVNQDRSPEVDDIEGLAAAATKHLGLVKQMDEAESSFIIEKAVRKLQAEH